MIRYTAMVCIVLVQQVVLIEIDAVASIDVCVPVEYLSLYDDEWDTWLIYSVVFLVYT